MDRWFLRMARWSRHPPSARHVKIVLAAVAICLILVGIERFIGWPDVLTLPPSGRVRIPSL